MSKRAVLGAAMFGGLVASAAGLGALFNPSQGGTRQWYRELSKPSFNPPDFIFAPVWTTLYIVVAISGYRVWSSDPSSERTRALTLWTAQLTLNAAWSPLFFGANSELALGDILLMATAILAYIAAARRVDKVAAFSMFPYFIWVAFASLLNAEIVRLNR